MKGWGFLPVLFFLCVLIAQPVAAQSQTIDAPEGEGLTSITFQSSVDTTGFITFYLNDGTTVESSWSYVTTTTYFNVFGVLVSNKEGTITVGSETNSNNYITPGALYTYYVLPGHDYDYENVTVPTLVGQIGQWKGAYDTMARTSIADSVVTSISFTTDNDVDVEYESAVMEQINYNRGLSLVDESKAGEWGYQIAKVLELAVKYLSQALGFIVTVFAWLKFFFVDNLGLIIALYMSVSMALAARAAKGNIGRFFSRFIDQQVKLFRFIIEIWQTLINSIGTVRGWFRI